MTTSAQELLDSLYEQFTTMSDQTAGGPQSAFLHSRRAALARARLFVLDQQAAECTVTV
ncbi:hypothetical protein M1M07_27985 [Rhodococcus sp. HM1]|uniref:hypothetical protein n=1 Tax=Rhodococcus sp. HM1 TaxID=2937759 RepID=UPI00200BA046|nr:hypothetical protein [Rhodococcus sp. HM1]MCK8674936.1 hypothetical protein [Rhodococcus sp. HM1]